MPVTTRAAALRSQIAEQTTASTKQAQSSEISTESEKHSSVVQQVAVPQIEPAIENNNHRDHENKRLIEEIDISIYSFFNVLFSY
ncbi:unnamed protein product [Rotaria magnacalcarata]|uniref:Uncharacterized protein n=1 Tax=Rotaria magnacalcarata TaxID=392030 RepID=A0A820A393_9BILA|nr:unnamed protein product [Rotaria magnacalcarata]